MTAGVLPLPLATGARPSDRPAPVAPATEDPVAQARAGDAGAFRGIYETHVGRVYALCLRMTGERGDAEELTQDVFVRAWERLGSFRGESSFSTWLYRLAVNTVLMARRTSRRRERRIVLAEHTAPVEGHGAERLDLERAIAGLPEGCRTVFVLHDVEGWRHHEIATFAGIAVGTSKAHLFRARRLLREALTR